jgi:hypothetical protein
MALKENMAIPGRWLRHKGDGQVFHYTVHLAKNANMEEVPEEIAFPEKFMPAAQKGRKAKVDLGTSEAEVESAKPKKETKAELAADAKKGLK